MAGAWSRLNSWPRGSQIGSSSSWTNRTVGRSIVASQAHKYAITAEASVTVEDLGSSPVGACRCHGGLGTVGTPLEDFRKAQVERIRVAIPDVWRERRHFVPRLVNCGGKTVLRSVRPGSNFKPTRPSYWSEVNSATATGMLPERDATMHPIVSGCRWTSSRSSAKG